MTQEPTTQAFDLSQSATHAPLPPVDATVRTIACEYCPVACGYKVYSWPVGTEPPSGPRPVGPAAPGAGRAW